MGLALLTLGLVFALCVMYSPIGLTFGALRDNQICAEARGINRIRFQLLVFAVSGIFTGLAGGVYAGILGTIGPDIFSLSLLLFLLSMMVVGGRGTRWGPVLGAAALMVVDSGLREIPEFRNFGLALIIILSMIFLPGGLVKLVHGIFHWQPRSLIKLERTDQQLRQFQNQKTSKTKVY